MANTIRFCPQCGQEGPTDQGTVFIEDGPWNGRYYANEGDYARYHCEKCGCTFGSMPEPMLCTKCGNEVYGEVGEDCDEDPDAGTIYDPITREAARTLLCDRRYICAECMHGQIPLFEEKEGSSHDASR